MASNPCLNDDSLGPSVRGCRGDFDFTIKFERIFLAIIPASVFVALSLTRLAYLLSKPRIVSAATLQFVKLAIIVVYATLQFSLLILLTTGDGGPVNGLSIAATAFNFVAGLAMIALSFVEHSRSPRPSMLLNAYVLLTLLFDIVQTRTSWLVAGSLQQTSFARLFTSSVAIKALSLFLEAQKKTRWLRWNVGEHSPEESSGIFSLGLYAWLNQLFLRGYRGVLSIDDLYALDKGMIAETTQWKLEQKLETPDYQGRKFRLAWALAKALAVPFLLPVAPRVALMAFSYSQSFFISTLLEYLQQPKDGATTKVAHGLIGAATLIYTGISLSSAFYTYYQWRALYMVRGCLTTAIYKKTTEAKSAPSSDAAAVTLMSTDVERIVRGFYNLHELWASTVEVVLGCWLLQRQLGAAFFAPIVTIFICVAIMSWVSRFTGKRQRAWMSRIQNRVGLTAKVISSMKSLKISGITDQVAELIQSLRVNEIKAGNRWRMISIIAATVAHVPMTVTPVVTFAVTSRNLDVTTTFTSLSYLVLLSNPLNRLFQSLPSLQAAFTCLGRVQNFLEAEPRVDFRRTMSQLRSDNETRFSEISRQVDSSTEKATSMEKRPVISEEVGTLQPKPEVAITIANGSFGWTPERMVLSNINTTIHTGQLTIVVGPVASGKSTLCKALLGEVPIAQGEVKLGSSYSSVAFCEQTPFLLNATFRENIIGYSRFNQRKYDEIMEATMLSIDINLLPSGHNTKIGSNGIMLSGGQKQRVSLARALYLESDLVIVDDILSALDNDTETEVFRRVFGPNGIVRRSKATTILCTHSVRHLPSADHIIALGVDGTIVEDNFYDLVENSKYVHWLGVKTADSDSSLEGEQETPEDNAPEIPKLPKSQVLSNELDKARQMGDFKVYRHYFSNTSKLSILLFLLSGVLFGIGSNFSTVWMRYWSEHTLNRSSAFYIGIYALLRASQLVSLAGGCVVVLISMITFSGTQLHKSALTTVVMAPLKFFTTTDEGIVINIFSQDMTLIDGELPMALINMCLNGFDVIGMAFVIAGASPYLAASYPVLLVALYVLQKFYLRTSRQMRLLDLEAKSPLYAHFLDTTHGVATIRAFGWVKQYIAHNNHLLDTSQRPAYLLAMIQQWLALILHVIVALIATSLVTLATQLTTNAGFTGASFVTLMAFGGAMTNIIQMYAQLETSIGAVSRLKTFSEKVVSENLPGEDIVPPEEWPQRGEIEIKGVSASYGSDTQSTSGNGESGIASRSNLALKDLTISIQPGDKVAICGRTGSGKSSLILLLLRLLDPLPSCSQNMSIDGLPLHRIDRATLRKRIIAVPQDAVFLPDSSTVKANLDPFNAASEDDCLAVLETVQLTSFVEECGGLHEGMSTDSLSAGQKQLFILGRAILRRRVRDRRVSSKNNGGILLLDEVSSTVDKDTDRAMQEIIKVEFADYTIVMVSHRLGMVMDFFKRVIVMDKGSVVETGSPRELVKVGSRFGEIWTLGNHVGG
ncbi:P-loop containing nucleoside triphosphate hydrolase protein [Zopfia rhizophila CBS 207.26]|uniref:P-loop containing nucleoside triphosphate hydrolase protein n=1 Tax=Zopfia rhizophila CBS 207.26 TaxID=1314779 RepID=A0A6A6D715_9PEZI|nr:P-loop containing nucleoside triphosphate hydrolase protein [Zopfia rhizophila CBS 207.26]